MTEQNKGGSDSTTPPASPEVGVGKNKTAKISMDQALAELEHARMTIGEKDQLISDLSGQLKEANDVLEGQEKAKLINEILPRSTFKIDELSGKSLEDLKNIRATLDQAMPPRVNSVRMGMSDLTDQQMGLTVGDLSHATRMRRQASGGN